MTNPFLGDMPPERRGRSYLEENSLAHLPAIIDWAILDMALPEHPELLQAHEAAQTRLEQAAPFFDTMFGRHDHFEEQCELRDAITIYLDREHPDVKENLAAAAARHDDAMMRHRVLGPIADELREIGVGTLLEATGVRDARPRNRLPERSPEDDLDYLGKVLGKKPRGKDEPDDGPTPSWTR